MTLTTQIRNKRRQRGGAMVEFALIVPIFVTLIFWSMYFTELVRARLRLIEAARFMVWEMTSYSVTDFDTGQNNHDKAFDEAKTAVMADANTKYVDLDSVDARPGLASMAMTANNFKSTMTNETINMVDGNVQAPAIGGVFSAIAGPLSSGANFILNHFEFNTKGKATVEVSIDVQSKILPKKYLDSSKTDVRGGNTTLDNKTIKSKYSMIVNGWHLRDGADALMGKNHGGNRAGGHDEGGKEEHSLKRQVDNMTYFGFGDVISGPLGTAVNVLSYVVPMPNFFGTYVVSHNFKKDPNASDADAKGTEDNVKDTSSEQSNCVSGEDPGNTGTGGTAGYIDLSQASELDKPQLRCFNTAPFRDTWQYKNNKSSLYREMFKARGEWFMGCRNAQADDPTFDVTPQQGDRQSNKQACGP